MKLKDKAVSALRYRLKAIRALSNIFSQEKTAKKLDGYIADFLNGKTERFIAVPKKAELAGKKIIWQYWHQGIDENTPKIVLSCLNSVKKHSNGYKIVILSKSNVNEYVELPAFVWKKLGKERFNFAKLANLIRLYLLYAYGGVWIDATHYLTGPIEENMLQKDFFAFQRSQAPPPDVDIFKKFDPLYFSWKPGVQVRLLNSFMVAKPNNKICGDLLSMLLEYWRREDKIGHYFFKQILFNRMMQNREWKNLNCEIVGDTDCHRLQLTGINKFDRQIYEEITAKSNIHKLTYRFEKFKQTPAGSFFDVIANGKIETGI